MFFRIVDVSLVKLHSTSTGTVTAFTWQFKSEIILFDETNNL
jgi:hypothetical protein